MLSGTCKAAGSRIQSWREKLECSAAKEDSVTEVGFKEDFNAEELAVHGRGIVDKTKHEWQTG